MGTVTDASTVRLFSHGTLAVPMESEARATPRRFEGRRAQRFLPLLLLFASLAYSVREVQSQQVVDRNKEYQVKSVFLYSFGRYIKWPDECYKNTADAFVIGIVGEDPLGDALDKIARKRQIQGHPILVRRLKTLDDYLPCHILFLPRSTSVDVRRQAVRRTQGQHVLLVGESTGFAHMGGAMNFYVEGDSVRFEINIQAARRENLTMDAKLLKLGRAVESS